MEKMERIARSRTCDAMVLTDMLVGDQRPALLASTGLPFIVRGTSPEPNTVAVGMDNIAVGNLAVRHLYELGHRRILCYNIWSDLMSGARRYEGIQQAVEQLGLKDEVEIVLKNDAPQYENEVYESVLKRLNQPNFPTAIFAGDEIMALGAERALRESGLKIPEDVSLMMCLNARMMRLAAPHITSINVRQNESATRCGRLIAEMLRGIPVERRQQFLQPTLIPSKTTAPPRKHSI
jgi:DNA-binding LacI/PurR family transcriptional regulator